MVQSNLDVAGISTWMKPSTFLVWFVPLLTQTFTIFLTKDKWLFYFYVDDMYLMGNHATKLAELRSYLKSRHEMIDCGTLNHSLGLEYIFQPEGIIVTQRSYVQQMLLDARLQDCNPARTPRCRIYPYSRTWKPLLWTPPNTNRWLAN